MKFSLPIVFGLLLSGTGCWGMQASPGYFNPGRTTKNIPDDVQAAKSRGLSEIRIPAPKTNWARAADMNTVLNTDPALLARLSGKYSAFYDADKTAIVTWLRFKKLDHIAGPRLSLWSPSPSAPAAITQDFEPGNDFVVRVFGGTMTIDGVTVVSEGPFLDVPVNNDYVLFVYRDENVSGQVSPGFHFGRASIIRVDKEGVIQPISGSDSSHVITRFMQANHIHDLASFRTALRKAHAPGLD